MAARQAVIAVTEIVRLLIRREVPVAAEAVLVLAAMETAVAHRTTAVVAEAAANREGRQVWYVFKGEIGRIIQIIDIHIGRACKAHFLSLSICFCCSLRYSSFIVLTLFTQREKAVGLSIA